MANLNPRNISPKIEEPPDVITDGGAVAGAVRKSINALMLTADGDEVQHRRIRTSLSNGAQELTALRESHRVVAVLKERESKGIDPR